ncbi:MAG TPA: hypothetical protein VF576_03445 [Rubricoccaceae bacterium]|jgi:hypothetical protein
MPTRKKAAPPPSDAAAPDGVRLRALAAFVGPDAPDGVGPGDHITVPPERAEFLVSTLHVARRDNAADPSA